MAEKTMKVEVRATILETRGGIKAKRGDVITIPAEESKQSGAIRHGLRSGNLKVILAETDLKPVTSTSAGSAQRGAAAAKDADKKKEEGKTSAKE